MMAPSELCFSSQVPYIMEICKETSDGEEIFEHTPNDNEIESTVVLSDANTLPEELYDGVSPTIVTILPDDSSDYPLLSLDDSEQHYVTVDDLAMSPLATIPTLSIASEDGWSEVGETLEVTEESLEITEDDEAYEHEDVQPIAVESPSDEVTTCTPTIYLIIDEEPYHFISAEEILLAQEEKLVATKQTKKSGKIAISKGKKAVKKKTRTYPCFEVGCNRSYTTVHHLKVHMRNHQGIRPYSCPVEGCFKAFSALYTCTAHIRTHTGEKPYKCTDCGKGFKTSGDLQKHTRTHTGERPFKCSFAGCDKAFTTSNIRKVHIRSHTGEKPYVCEVPGCGRRFSSSTNYKNHMRIHSGEKPYACTVEGCDGRFTEYSSLYKHRNAHKQRERSYLGGKPCKKGSSHANSPSKSSPNIIRSTKNSIKKVLRDFKQMSSSLMSLHEDESDDFGNDNATLDISIDNKLEVYQLIFNEDLEIK